MLSLWVNVVLVIALCVAAAVLTAYLAADDARSDDEDE